MALVTKEEHLSLRSEQRKNMAERNKGGRPLKFKTVAELQEKIDAYFYECDNHRTEVVAKNGDIVLVKRPTPKTITGLALALETTRETLLDYELLYKDYNKVVREAKMRCQNDTESRGLAGELSAPVTIFTLKNNYGWKDKQEIEQTGDMGLNISVVNFATDNTVEENTDGDTPTV